MAKKLKTKSYLALVPFFLIQIVWGSYFLIAKNLQTQVHVYFLHFLRFALLSVIFLPFALKFLKDKKLIWSGIIAGLLLAGSNYLLNIGLNLTSSVNAAFLIGLTTIFVTIIEVIFFRAKMEKTRILATLLAVIGMWFITGGVKGIDLGDTVLIIGSVIGAFHVIFLDKDLNSKSKSKSNIFPHLFWQMFVCAVVGFVMNIFYGSFVLPELSATLIGEFLYLALISMGLGMIVQMWTQERVNPIVVSIIALFQSIFGAVIGWTLGNEPFVIAHAIGGGIILVGMFLSVVADGDADLKSLD